MDFIHKLVTPAVDYPVSPAEARDQIEVGDDSFDSKLELWIPAATAQFERMTRRALMPQTWMIETEDLVREVELPRPPLIEVTSVMSKERVEDEWEEVDEADYVVQENRSPVRITWIDQQPRMVQVTYEAGYASSAEVPADYKLSILQLIAHYSENRGDVEARLPIALKAMIASQGSGTRLGFFAS
jgi:uncharacterized phiE125 gp8 family phage protein